MENKKIFKFIAFSLAFLICFFSLYNSSSMQAWAELVVNEIVARDPNGGSDWIEFFVTGIQPVYLRDYSVVDDGAGHVPEPLPDIFLQPGEFIVIQATSTAPNNGSYYMPYGLGGDDCVTLYLNGNIVDVLDWVDGDAPEGYSYGRLPDGIGTAKTLMPTPNLPNKAPITSALIINEIVAKNAAGGNDWIEFYVIGDYPVYLRDYAVADDAVGRVPAPLPNIFLEPGEFAVVQATTNDPNDGSYYVPFGLGGDDCVTLYLDGNIVDVLDWVDGDAPEGFSYGRFPDGTDDAMTLAPTMGTANQLYEPFITGIVGEINVEIAEEDWQAILANPMAEEYQPCNITYNGFTIGNVAIRTKGQSSLMSVAMNPNSNRYSFKIDINYYMSQDLFGLQKINLNNGFSDPTLMREYLSYELMRSMGIPTPRTCFMNLYINDELMGLYLAVEAVDDEFAESRFVQGDGDLYKAEMGSDLLWRGTSINNYSNLELKTNEDTSDHSALLTMLDELNNGSDYASVINVEEVLRYFAVSTVLTNLDSYQGTFAQNYYLYEENGIFYILPWDFNMSFAGFNMGCPRESLIGFMIDEPTMGALNDRPLIARLLQNPNYLQLYHGFIIDLISGPFAPQSMDQFIDATADMIRPYVYADTTKFFTDAQFEQGLIADITSDPNGGFGFAQGFGQIIGLKTFVHERVASIIDQLNGTVPSSGDGSGNCAGGFMPGPGEFDPIVSIDPNFAMQGDANVVVTITIAENMMMFSPDTNVLSVKIGVLEGRDIGFSGLQVTATFDIPINEPVGMKNVSVELERPPYDPNMLPPFDPNMMGPGGGFPDPNMMGPPGGGFFDPNMGQPGGGFYDPNIAFDPNGPIMLTKLNAFEIRAAGGGQPSMIESVSPSFTMQGATDVLLTITLSQQVMLPLDMIPTGMSVGMLQGSNITRNRQSITATFNIPPNESPGMRDVSVTFPAPPFDPNTPMVFTGYSAFEILASGEPTSMIETVSPISAMQGDMNVLLTITLSQQVMLPLDMIPTGMSVGMLQGSNITRNGQSITATFNIPPNESPGMRDVSVTFPAPPFDPNIPMVFTKYSAFEILASGGVTSMIETISPTFAMQGNTNILLTITISPQAMIPPDVIPIASVNIGTLQGTNITRNGLTITALFNIPFNEPVGMRDVSVTFPPMPFDPNAQPTIITETNAFEIREGIQLPVIENVSPSSALQGDMDVVLTITLSQQPMLPPDILPVAVNIGTLQGDNILRNGLLITAMFDIPAGEALGLKDVSVMLAQMPADPTVQPVIATASDAFQIGRSNFPFDIGETTTDELVTDIPTFAPGGLYDETILRTIYLDFDQNDWWQQLENNYTTEENILADLTMEGVIYPDVGVRFKGMTSYAITGASRKKSFNIEIDFANPDQRLMGYKTLNLNNSSQDPTFIREVLYFNIFRKYAPCPQANFVKLVINGEDWGIYVNAQQQNSNLIEEWFGSSDGDRWKVGMETGGGFVVMVLPSFEEWLDSTDAQDLNDDGQITEEDYDIFVSTQAHRGGFWGDPNMFDPNMVPGGGFWGGGNMDPNMQLSFWLNSPQAQDMNDDGVVDEEDFNIFNSQMPPAGGWGDPNMVPPWTGGGTWNGDPNTAWWIVDPNAPPADPNFAPGWWGDPNMHGGGGFWGDPNMPGGGGMMGGGNGALTWLGSDTAPYEQAYELKSENTSDPWSHLIEACDILNNTPLDQLAELADSVLAVDRWLWFLAMENIFTDEDSYLTKGWDYQIYYDPETGQIHPLQHDGNETFEPFFINRNPFEGEMYPSRPLLSKLLAIPQFRERYLAHIRTIIEESFNWSALEPQVEAYRALIADEVMADTKKLYSNEQFEQGFTEIEDFVNNRRNYLLQNLEIIKPTPEIFVVNRKIVSGEITQPLPGEPVWIIASVEPGVDIGQAVLYYTAGVGPFEPLPMFFAEVSGSAYSGDILVGEIPGLPAGSIVRYYVEIRSVMPEEGNSFSPYDAENYIYTYRVYSSFSTTPTIIINELMASNNTISDPQGDYDDWIELLNIGDQEADLSGMYLSDNADNPLKWQIPTGTTLAPGAFLLIWADEDTNDEPGLHANFKLSAGGEVVLLTDRDERGNSLLDSVEFGSLGTDESYSRVPNGTGQFHILTMPTPNTINIPSAFDVDGDGFTPDEGDIDDNDAAVFPGNTETTCNGKDDDCDVLTPDDPDSDGDGVSLCSGDCDDNNPAIYPGATEVNDGIDNNCDGIIDSVGPGGSTGAGSSYVWERPFNVQVPQGWTTVFGTTQQNIFIPRTTFSYLYNNLLGLPYQGISNLIPRSAFGLGLLNGPLFPTYNLYGSKSQNLYNLTLQNILWASHSDIFSFLSANTFAYGSLSGWFY